MTLHNFLNNNVFKNIRFKNNFYGGSLINKKRIEFMVSLMEELEFRNVKGNVIECGVFKGGSLIEIASKLKELDSHRIVFGLDTFTGMPYADKGTECVKGYLESNFKKVLNKVSYLDNISLIEGKFKDSFKILKDHSFSFAHLDCDVYKSYIECLKFLMPRMSNGGIIWFDDYNSDAAPRCNDAVHKFIKKKDLIILPKKQAYYYVK